MAENSSQLYLTLDPVQALAGTARELPITIYENEIHVVDEKPTMRFAAVPYKIDSIESERCAHVPPHSRSLCAAAADVAAAASPALIPLLTLAHSIAVDHIAHILPTGDSNAGSAYSQHLGTQYTAVSMLAERIDTITRYLDAVAKGTVQADHEILRQIKSLTARLPALDTAKFADESLRDFNSSLLVAYLGCITKGTGMVNDVVDKYNLAYDKHSRRGRGIF